MKVARLRGEGKSGTLHRAQGPSITDQREIAFSYGVNPGAPSCRGMSGL